MSVWRLIFKEIRHRVINFMLAALSVLVATATLVAAMTLLSAQEDATRRLLAKHEDDTRKSMKKLGFNVVIFPEGQNRSELYEKDYYSKTMPERYVKTLADSRIMTVNHLLPILQQKATWNNRSVILVGTRGEVPLMHREPKKPIITAVEPDTLILGYELHTAAGLKPGDETTFLGRRFTVAKCHEPRMNKDDITLWMDLAQAQRLLKKEGQINAILALSCHCSGARLTGIRDEIAGILPGTQVIEYSTKAIARAEARAQAAALHRATMGRYIAFASRLVPVVLIGCAAAVAALAFYNVRDRRGEIGILRALGMSARGVLVIFLGKASIAGVIGACVGCALGFVVAAQSAEASFDWLLCVIVIVAAPALAALATWIPALIASQQDPAVVLREE